MTIAQAAKKVLDEAGKPMTVDEIYAAIRRQELFDFKAKSPKQVLRATLVKNSINSRSRKRSGQVFLIEDGGMRFKAQAT